MLAYMSARISSYLVQNNIVENEDESVYQYGLEVLFSTLLNFLVLYSIAFFFGKMWEMTVYALGFIPLRALAGGYHAKTHLRCTVLLVLICLGALTVIMFAPPSIYRYITISSACLSIALVCILSPIEDENKPLNENEKEYFKRKSRLAVFVYSIIIAAGTFLLQNRIEFLSLSLGVISASLSLAVAYFRGRRAFVSNGG